MTYLSTIPPREASTTEKVVTALEWVLDPFAWGDPLSSLERRESTDNDNAMIAFSLRDAATGSSDGLLNREEAEKEGLTFVDPNGDGYMSASEVDFFGEADKVCGVVEDRISLDEAKQQGLTFFDGDGDGLMSRSEYADVQSGAADVFGAADRAGGVVDDLITREEAAAQGLMFVDESFPDAPADGFMSRQEYERAALTQSSTYVAHLTTNSDGSNHKLSFEEASNQGLVFFDGNGDDAMSATELFQVLEHKVGGVPTQ